MKKYLLIAGSIIIIIIALASYFFYFKDKIRINEEIKKVEEINNVYESYKKGDLDTTIELSKELLEKDPNNIKYQIQLAEAYLNKGSIDHEESTYAPMAIEIINAVLEKEPNNSEAYRVLGYANEILQKFDEAIKNYDKSIELDNNNALAYNARGHAYELMGEINMAADDYEKAYEINPEEPFIWSNISRLALGFLETKTAKEFALKVANSTTSDYIKATSELVLAQAYLMEGDSEKALESSTMAIKILPKLIFGYISRANIIINKYYGDETKIITEEDAKIIKSDLDTAISLNPNSAFSHSHYARFFEITKEYDKAIEYYNKSISILEKKLDLAVPVGRESVVADSHREAIERINNLKK